MLFEGAYDIFYIKQGVVVDEFITEMKNFFTIFFSSRKEELDDHIELSKYIDKEQIDAFKEIWSYLGTSYPEGYFKVKINFGPRTHNKYGRTYISLGDEKTLNAWGRPHEYTICFFENEEYV
jgi:hypothetical protein